MEYTPGRDKYLDALVLLQSAMKCFDTGEYESAIEQYTIVMQLTEKHADVLRSLRADAYKEKGDYDRALADYDQAIELNPENVRAYTGRGDLFERIGDRTRAIADFTKALALNPDMLPQYIKQCEDALNRLRTTN
jgi:tetratricopeptide (TPR) repeat protein